MALLLLTVLEAGVQSHPHTGRNAVSSEESPTSPLLFHNKDKTVCEHLRGTEIRMCCCAVRISSALRSKKEDSCGQCAGRTVCSSARFVDCLVENWRTA